MDNEIYYPEQTTSSLRTTFSTSEQDGHVKAKVHKLSEHQLKNLNKSKKQFGQSKSSSSSSGGDSALPSIFGDLSANKEVRPKRSCDVMKENRQAFSENLEVSLESSKSDQIMGFLFTSQTNADEDVLSVAIEKEGVYEAEQKPSQKSFIEYMTKDKISGCGTKLGSQSIIGNTKVIDFGVKVDSLANLKEVLFENKQLLLTKTYQAVDSLLGGSSTGGEVSIFINKLAEDVYGHELKYSSPTGLIKENPKQSYPRVIIHNFPLEKAKIDLITSVVKRKYSNVMSDDEHIILGNKKQKVRSLVVTKIRKLAVKKRALILHHFKSRALALNKDQIGFKPTAKTEILRRATESKITKRKHQGSKVALHSGLEDVVQFNNSDSQFETDDVSEPIHVNQLEHNSFFNETQQEDTAVLQGHSEGNLKRFNSDSNKFEEAVVGVRSSHKRKKKKNKKKKKKKKKTRHVYESSSDSLSSSSSSDCDSDRGEELEPPQFQKVKKVRQQLSGPGDVQKSQNAQIHKMGRDSLKKSQKGSQKFQLDQPSHEFQLCPDSGKSQMGWDLHESMEYQPSHKFQMGVDSHESQKSRSLSKFLKNTNQLRGSHTFEKDQASVKFPLGQNSDRILKGEVTNDFQLGQASRKSQFARDPQKCYTSVGSAKQQIDLDSTMLHVSTNNFDLSSFINGEDNLQEDEMLIHRIEMNNEKIDVQVPVSLADPTVGKVDETSLNGQTFAIGLPFDLGDLQFLQNPQDSLVYADEAMCIEVQTDYEGTVVHQGESITEPLCIGGEVEVVTEDMGSLEKICEKYVI